MYKKNTQYQDNEATFSCLVRVGIVTAADNEKRLAQVFFQDTNLSSGWIPVLINRDFIPDYDAPQKTEFENGGTGLGAYDSHKHDLIIKPWMPKVGDQVLCLYETIRDGRGFVLGGIQAWQQ